MGSVTTILQANNITRMDQATYDANVWTQKANNKKEAANITLADFSRSLGNTLRVEGAGREFNEAVSNLASSLESRTMGKLNSSLAAAERTGALLAQAGAQGVGGTSVDLLSDTIKLQRNIEQDLQQQTTDRMASQGGRANAQIMDNALSQTDLQRQFGSFDYTVYIAPKAMKRRLGKLIGVAAATWFGGPQAGEAAADAMVGSWQAENGNFAGAAKSFDSAVQGAAGAWQDYNERGGGSWFGAVTQRNNQKADAAANKQSINWGGFAPNDEGTSFGTGFGKDWFSGD